MTNQQKEKLHQSCFSNKVLKFVTLFLFYLLPSRISKIFVSLSIISAIFDIRKDGSYRSEETVERIGKVLRVHLTENILLLPEQTLGWYWSKEFFDIQLCVDSKSITIREAILNKEFFNKNKNLILNKMLDALPSSMKNKLGLSEKENRDTIKFDIFNAFEYA